MYCSGAGWGLISWTNSVNASAAGRNVFGSKALVYSKIVVQLNGRITLAVLVCFKFVLIS